MPSSTVPLPYVDTRQVSGSGAESVFALALRYSSWLRAAQDEGSVPVSLLSATSTACSRVRLAHEAGIVPVDGVSGIMPLLLLSIISV